MSSNSLLVTESLGSHRVLMLNTRLHRHRLWPPFPDTLDFTTAAALPTAGSTALQITRDVVAAKSGMTILIHGAAGGVGSYASQIAKHLGARVIGTAASGDIEYLKSLGVDEIVDYQRERFEDKAIGVDAVVDLVGGDTLARSYGVIKR